MGCRLCDYRGWIKHGVGFFMSRCQCQLNNGTREAGCYFLGEFSTGVFDPPFDEPLRLPAGHVGDQKPLE